MTYWCAACGRAATPDPSMTAIDPRYQVGSHCGGRRQLVTDSAQARALAARWDGIKAEDRARRAQAVKS